MSKIPWNNGNRRQAPCYNYPDHKCPKRHPGCHDTCEEMQAVKAANQADRELHAKQKAHDSVLNYLEIKRTRGRIQSR